MTLQERRHVYLSDLTGEKRAFVESFFDDWGRRGRPNLWPLRRVMDAIFYVLRSGCA
jgi:transposase